MSRALAQSGTASARLGVGAVLPCGPCCGDGVQPGDPCCLLPPGDPDYCGGPDCDPPTPPPSGSGCPCECVPVDATQFSFVQWNFTATVQANICCAGSVQAYYTATFTHSGTALLFWQSLDYQQCGQLAIDASEPSQLVSATGCTGPGSLAVSNPATILVGYRPIRLLMGGQVFGVSFDGQGCSGFSGGVRVAEGNCGPQTYNARVYTVSGGISVSNVGACQPAAPVQAALERHARAFGVSVEQLASGRDLPPAIVRSTAARIPPTDPRVLDHVRRQAGPCKGCGE